jgi:hypothetical protein
MAWIWRWNDILAVAKNTNYKKIKELFYMLYNHKTESNNKSFVFPQGIFTDFPEDGEHIAIIRNCTYVKSGFHHFWDIDVLSIVFEFENRLFQTYSIPINYEYLSPFMDLIVICLNEFVTEFKPSYLLDSKIGIELESKNNYQYVKRVFNPSTYSYGNKNRNAHDFIDDADITHVLD